MKITFPIKILPTLLTFSVSVLVIHQLIQPSPNPQILIFSYLRATVLLIFVISALYLFISFFSSTLIKSNNYIIYYIVAGLVVTEVVLRSFSSAFPLSVVRLLPYPARLNILGPHGYFLDMEFLDDGIFYRLKPNSKNLEKPWVRIDSLGYRNTTDINNPTDIIILGASIPSALAMTKDLGDYIRDSGFSVYSLALGGYSPQHYLTAYRRFIVERGVRHKYLIIFSGTDDLKEALDYDRVEKMGGDFRNYLGQGFPTPIGYLNEKYVPWVLMIPYRAAPEIRNFLFGNKIRENKKNSFLKLSYANIEVDNSFFNIPDEVYIDAEQLPWKLFSENMSELLKLANEQGVKILFVNYPSPNIIYGPYLVGHESYKRHLSEIHDKINVLFSGLMRSHNATYFDLTPFMQRIGFEKDIAEEPLTLGYHLNENGLNKVADKLVDTLEKINGSLAEPNPN